MQQPEIQKKFKVYTASAGAGKTFRLTLEYLKIALRNPTQKFRRILAITFTVKATNEMKARIIEACKAFSKANIEELVGRNLALLLALEKETHWTREQIAKKSYELYRTILHNYGDFAVSTIDSFSQRIIRSFAYELGKPINFEIELDTAKIADHLTAKLLAKVGAEDKNFTELIVNFFEEKLKEDDSIYIEYDIQKAVKIMLEDDSQEPIAKLSKFSSEQLLNIGKEIDKKYYQLQKIIEAEGEKAVNLMKEFGFQITDFSGGKARSVAYHFERVIQNSKTQPSDTFKKVSRGDANWFTKSSKISNPELESQLSEIAARLVNLASEVLMISEIKKSFPRMAMLVELRRIFNEYQNEEEFLLISEFNKIISEQVKGQPAPFLYEKVGEQFEHILIDEFQDTSVMQWHNLVPLVVESLEKSAENESLVVGDSKQAIYRWRGGETKQLTALPKLIGSENDVNLQDSERTFDLYLEREPMEYNFRSREEIVKFNNRLFQFITDRDELTPFHQIYKESSQKPFRKTSGGYIQMNQIERKATGEEKQHYYDRLFQVFEEQLNQVFSHGYSGGDIAIICRNNRELELIAQFLQEKGKSFTSKESLRLRHEKAIEIFPSLVRLFAYPHHQILQAEVANFLLDYGVIQADRKKVNELIGKKRLTSLSGFAKLMEEIEPTLQFTQLNQAELLPLWEQFVSWLPIDLQNSTYVSFFRDELWQFITINGNNLEAFLDWWDENYDELFVKSSDAAEGIQLLTIHKSKGLEFEVVMMPFSNWKFTVSTENRWVTTDLYPDDNLRDAYLPMKKEMGETAIASEFQQSKEDIYLDNLNLLYVATTRAVSELYLIIDDFSEKNKKELIGVAQINQFLNTYFDWGNSNEMSFGQPTTAKRKAKAELNEIQLPVKQAVFGQVGVAVNNRASVIWSEDVRDKIDFGSVVHTLLENIKSRQDISPAVYQAVADGFITEEQQEELQSMIQNVVDHPDLTDYFQRNLNILAEQAIITPEGKEFIPDRIILNENENTVKILDFKTGKQNSSHKKQIEAYAELLKLMNYKVIEKKLVYLQPFEIQSI